MRRTSYWLLPVWFVLAACGAPSGESSTARVQDAAVADVAPENAAAPATIPGSGSAAAGEAEVAAEVTATERALAQLSAAYGELAERFGDEPGNAIDWAEADIENLGDWEYRVVVLPDGPPEALEEALNMLGQERWEAVWIEPSRNGMRIFLKRPAISYLSRVPLSTLVRMLTGGAQ